MSKHHTLPFEIVDQICWSVHNSATYNGITTPININKDNTLANLCLVSKQWYKAASSFLYHSPPLFDAYKWKKTAWSTIAENQQIALKVKKVFIGCHVLEEEFEIGKGRKYKLSEIMLIGLQNTCNLTHLHVTHFEDFAGDPIKKILSCAFPKLRHLQIDGDIRLLLSLITLPKVESLEIYSNQTPPSTVFKLIPKLLESQEPQRLKHFATGTDFSQPGLPEIIRYIPGLQNCIQQTSRFQLRSLALSSLFLHETDLSLVELLKTMENSLENLEFSFVSLSPDFFSRAASSLTNLRTLKLSSNHEVNRLTEYPIVYRSIFNDLLPNAPDIESVTIKYVVQGFHKASTISSPPSSPSLPFNEEGAVPFPLTDKYLDNIVAPVASKLHTLEVADIEIPARSLCRFSHAPISRMKATLAGSTESNYTLLSKEDIELVLKSFPNLTDLTLLNYIDDETMHELGDVFPLFLRKISRNYPY